MKLQKLLYFTYGFYAAKTEKPLFSESFQAWQYGPVLASVYQKFKCFGGSVINRMSTDAQGKAYMLNRGAPENKSIYEVFSKICKKYSRDRGFDLSKEKHKPGTPWAETLANGIILLIQYAITSKDKNYNGR